MLEQIEARTGVRPTELLVDGGYSSHDAIHDAIEKAAAAGVTPLRAGAQAAQHGVRAARPTAGRPSPTQAF